MLARLALLFVIVPLVELVLLVQLGQAVGLAPTLLLVVATGIAGAGLARREGLRTWLAFQRELAQGRLPGTPLLDGLAVLVGGAFLLTPGILTDVAGFVLLLPPSRAWLRRRMRRWLERQIEAGTVRVVSFGSGLGGFGAFGGGGPTGSADAPAPGPGAGLDPRHEIRQGDDGA